MFINVLLQFLEVSRHAIASPWLPVQKRRPSRWKSREVTKSSLRLFPSSPRPRSSRYSGATPGFVDIQPDTCNLNVSQHEAAIALRSKTMIMAVSL